MGAIERAFDVLCRPNDSWSWGKIGRCLQGPIQPYLVARSLLTLLPRNAILVGDGADALNWLLAYHRVYRAPGYFDHYPYGSMGTGTATAVGAAAAAHEIAREHGEEPKPAVLWTGDGSFGFYVSELNSAALAGLPLTAIVINDAGWGTERHGQRKAIGRTINVDLEMTPFDLVAEGYGCLGISVESVKAIIPALQRGLAAGRPAVLNVPVDPESGAVRKHDPRIQMIPLDDINASRRSHDAPVVS